MIKIQIPIPQNSNRNDDEIKKDMEVDIDGEEINIDGDDIDIDDEEINKRAILEDIDETNSKTESGFIAQEIEVIPELNI